METVISLMTAIILVSVMFIGAMKFIDTIQFERGGLTEVLVMICLSILCFFSAYHVGLAVLEYLM